MKNDYRLGFMIDFLSKATLVGFMAGAAIIVSLQQLKALLGITHFTRKCRLSLSCHLFSAIGMR